MNMIKTLRVAGLNQRFDFDLDFHEDLNILTGKNGSGKTSVLKLIWYIISGNLERIPSEIPVREAELVTDSFTLSLTVSPAGLEETATAPHRRRTRVITGEGSEAVNWSWVIGNVSGSETMAWNPLIAEHQLNDLNRKIVEVSGTSVFFPTFRRIEGGFSMNNRKPSPSDDYSTWSMYRLETGSVERALSELSKRLSVARHTFVSSISTNDIADILTKQYAELSDKINREHSALSRSIRSEIEKYSRQRQSNPGGESDAASVLERIRSEVAENSQRQEVILKPLNVLSELVTRIFHQKGIQVTSNLTLGEASQAIASDILSAGEKQMLSFLAYNAFSRKSVMMIDEPEISLHVDWQRILFPTLLSQGTNNQFVTATHSPFIYSRYGDKELLLDRDRG
jgi:predicted ATP-dependent endonuclease of OLD family